MKIIKSNLLIDTYLSILGGNTSNKFCLDLSFPDTICYRCDGCNKKHKYNIEYIINDRTYIYCEDFNIGYIL